MANKIWAGTTGDWSVAGNWSPSGVPVGADNVRIPAGTVAITAGLNQSAVTLGDLIIEDGYNSTIASSAAYLQVGCARLIFNGFGASYIDIGSSAISPQVYKTANAATGYRGLYLKGSAIATLAVMAGTVGLAALPFETSTVTTCRVSGTGSLWLGSGVTATTVLMLGGDATVKCALTTLRIHSGTVTTAESGTITTVDIDGGKLVSNSTGTITTMTIDGGAEVDMFGTNSSRTITTLKNNWGTIAYDPAVVTITNKSDPDDPVRVVAYRAF